MGLGKSKKSELKYHIDVEEFIPYAAHFDEETLITKNGELLQIIKLTGFAFEAVKEEKDVVKSLRGTIREAIQKNIKTDNFSIWINTIRRQRDISTGGVYPNDFSAELNEKWVGLNSWRTQFVNELYITIIYEGEIFPIKSPSSFIDNLFVKTRVKERKEKLLLNAIKLSNATGGIIKDLEAFGARKLSVFKRNDVYYSELISLASKLMNLRQEDIPVQAAELASILPTHKVSFQYNTVLVEGATGKHFGAVFSIKGYREVTDEELDKLIQLPVNFIIAQSFDFVTKEKAYESFEDQKKIYELSNAKRMAEISGIKEIFETEAGPTSFGQTQIVITVLEGSVKGLQKATSDVVDTLRSMGITFVREDMFMENCYWSMMPANFDFIKRQTYIPFSKICGLGSLHNFTTGKLRDNKWGNAVTTLPTRQGMPYFFNFHAGNSGHTAIIGSEDNKTLLTRFLISQAQKFSPRTFVIEVQNNSGEFIKSLGGKALTEESSFEQNILDKSLPAASFVISAQKEKLLNLINKIENSLDDNRPCIIVISDEFTKLEDAELSEKICDTANRLTEKNAIMILLSDGSGSFDNPGIFDERVTDILRTKIVLPRPEANLDFKELFRLKEKEIKEIKKLNEAEGEFIIKRALDSVVVKLDLSQMQEQQKLLKK